jgi:predicted nucleic acid-binding protein
MANALVGHTLCVTFVTVAEMARWADKRRWGTRKRTQLIDWLARRPVLPYAAEVSWRWGALVAAAERRGRPRPVNDTWIAACCLIAELPLATLNTKDFTDYADHDGLRLFPAAPRR